MRGLSVTVLCVGMASALSSSLFSLHTNPKSTLRLQSAVGEMTSDQKDQLLGKQVNTPVSHAIICGGGPVGLATALMLAKEHKINVSVYEAATLDETFSYDASKAFMYLVNERGQSFTKSYPFLQKMLEERGVSQGEGSTFITVPSEEEKPIETRSFSVLKRKKVDRTSKDMLASDESDEDENVSYWIPRHEMVEILHLAIKDFQDSTANDQDPPTGTIKYHPGKRCIEVTPLSDDTISVVVEDVKTGKVVSDEGSLIVCADGWRSKVREYLEENRKTLYSGWNGSNKSFKVRKWTSPSTGLRLKALQMPARFSIPDGESIVETKSTNPIVINGKNKGPQSFLRLGCLCLKNNDVKRPANCVTRSDHDMWKLETGEEARQWFNNAFPKMPFQKEADGGIISDEEWDRFAKAKGTIFPPCQYSPKLQLSSPEGGSGIVLLGDAAHAFPPDIGQGINAGLQDVVQFDKDLSDTMSQPDAGNIGSILQQYEKKRVPETKALIQLARVGAPYQYNQPHYIDRINKMLFTMNVIFRMLLNKITFGFLSKPCIMAAMDKEMLTFRQVMRRANFTTATILTLSGLILSKLFNLQRLVKVISGTM